MATDNGQSTVWSNPQTTPASYVTTEESNGSRLVRLVEDSDVVKHIEFDELSIEYRGPQHDGGAIVKQEELGGATYPMIRVNDTVMAESFIRYMSITSNEFIPKIELCLRFASEHFAAKDMPKDGDMISVFMRTTTDALNYLRDDFIVTRCDCNDFSSNAGRVDVVMEGKLFVPGLETDRNLYGVIGSSKTAVRETAKRFGLGFSYNDPDDTDDVQNWICCGSAATFVESVTEHSWKDSTSFFKSWVDLYYDLCFVNVNKFLLSSENTEDEVDITFSSNTLELQRIIGNNSRAESAKMSMKILTNDSTLKGSPLYIRSWSPVTNTSVSTTYGYSDIAHSFMHNQNLFRSKDKVTSSVTNIPAYDQSKTDTYMIMRGRSTYDPLLNPKYEQARANHAFAEEYMQFSWNGVAYVMADDDKNHTDTNNTWSGNVHKNYNRAPGHNFINNVELEKMYITVELDGLCLQVMRGERVPVVLYHDDMMMPTHYGVNNPNMPDNINRMYSGFYIVDAVEYSYSGKQKGDNNRFTTVLTLKRREWPTPEMITRVDNDSDQYVSERDTETWQEVNSTT